MPSSAASRDPLWPLESAGSLRSWLGDQSVRWCEQDDSFAAHRAIALLELEAGADYKALTQRHWAAKAAYKTAEGRPRVEDAERALLGGEKAVAGLRAYANAGSDADSAEVRLKRSRAQEKLAAFSTSEPERCVVLEQVREACAEWAELDDASRQLQHEQARLGLPALELKAKQLERQRGKSSSAGGRSFEREAGEPLAAALAGLCAESGDAPGGAAAAAELVVRSWAAEVEALAGVPLGAGGTGLTQLRCTRARKAALRPCCLQRDALLPPAPVNVLQMVTTNVQVLQGVTLGMARVHPSRVEPPSAPSPSSPPNPDPDP